MKIKELEKAAAAPERGMALILARSGVLYRSYGSLAEVDELMNGLDVLEIHLFDQDREYRCIKSDSKRYENRNGIIEHIADFREDPVSVYEESVILENKAKESSGKERITILNHIAYDDDPATGSGMAIIDDYRLKG